jgi:hypothetical protein
VTKAKPCKDCVAAGRPLNRPAPHPGPRCATDHRAFKKAQKERNHDRMVQTVYGLAPGDYERLLQAQGGTCAVHGCRANGKSKKLAVDHDHATGEVRGILCGRHNQLIGYHRDSPEAFRSIAAYLESPPARLVLLDPSPDRGVSSGNAE